MLITYVPLLLGLVKALHC